MFHSARLKLTLWYLAIIMLVSVLFSLVIYAGFNSELSRFEHLHQLRIEREQGEFFAPAFPRRLANIDPGMIMETRNRLTLVLIMVNLGILIVSGAASYLLAGRTLQPIKEMLEEQNRFITDASHELRTPLTSLRSEIEVNLRNDELTLLEAKKLLQSNLEEVVSLQSLADNLMELAQYGKKNGNLQFKPLSLLAVVQKAFEKITSLAKNKHITLKNEVKDTKIKGNEQSLTELFIILLDNAVKYSHKNSRVWATSEKNDESITVRIKDEGIGIEKTDLPHIFDRFYRTDKSRSKYIASGYGLGLSIAQKIVALHNGQISVVSETGKGSVFCVQLPTHH